VSDPKGFHGKANQDLQPETVGNKGTGDAAGGASEMNSRAVHSLTFTATFPEFSSSRDAWKFSALK
jgi:hypothetical protein